MARRFVILLTALLLLASACGEEGTGSDIAGGAGSFPVTLATAGGEVTVPERPERIVALSPTATEMLFAIEAGEQVVAVDDNSNYPPDVPTTDLSGFKPNVEAVADFDPDLVVYAHDAEQLGESLDVLGIPAVFVPAATTLDDTYAQIGQLGVATGHVVEAEQLVAQMRRQIEELAADVHAFADPPTYYHELDQTFFSVTSETFIGQVYSLAGLSNIADAAEGAGSQYPQLSAEFIIDADPNLVFLADTKCCDVTAETVAQRPGWSELTAVQQGHVIELDDDIASRWGPRVVDLLEVVVEEVSELESVGS